jgi:prepilin-type N-terminal cleavage/methylation domain-containing protein
MRSRTGFTLIELMVAMALTLFIMVILSQAFVLALTTFSGLKGIGDMQLNLRSAATIIRSDLGNYHFDGSRRVSDPDIAINPPRQGFFMVYQGKPSYEVNGANRISVWPNTCEGLDTEGVYSYVSVNHVLYFTTRLLGNSYEDFYRTPLGAANGLTFLNLTPLGVNPQAAADSTLTPIINQPNVSQTFASAWAEIYYCLMQTGSTAEPDNPGSTLGTPLYGLYRVMYVVPTDTLLINTKIPPFGAAAVNDFTGVSHGPALVGNPAHIDFFTPDDLANAQQPLFTTVGPNTKTPTNLRATRSLPMVPTPQPQYVTLFPKLPPTLKWVAAPAGGTLTNSIKPIQIFGDPTGLAAPRNALQVLPNVLSFNLQVMPKPDARFTTFPYFTDPEPQLGSANTIVADPGSGDPQINTPRLYDTGNYYDAKTFAPITAPTARYPYSNYPYPVMAIQITLRVWDTRSQQARQVTIVQDL